MEQPSFLTNYWTENGGRLKQFICIKVNDDDCCNDILHDLFLKIKSKEEKIALLEKPASYIIKMAQNAVADYYRLQKGGETALAADAETAKSEIFTETELYNISLTPFIERLPKQYQEALILSDLEGLSQKEVAERLSLSYTAAKSRVQRARLLLKKAILDCCNYRFDKFGNIIDVDD